MHLSSHTTGLLKTPLTNLVFQLRTYWVLLLKIRHKLLKIESLSLPPQPKKLVPILQCQKLPEASRMRWKWSVTVVLPGAELVTCSRDIFFLSQMRVFSHGLTLFQCGNYIKSY